MKVKYREMLLAVLLGMVVPGLILGIGVNRKTDMPEIKEPQMIEEPVPTEGMTSVTVGLLMPDGTVQDMDLEEYLVGVVMAEMPASFETEALKAQAVVARTYTLKCAQAGVKHGSGNMCTDHSCCQAYVSPEGYSGGDEDREKICSAVEQTAGQVLTYGGNLIEATYFSCSGGVTEDAVAVWGTDYPYLRSVESPGEEYATYYSDEVFFTGEQFQSRLGRELSGSAGDWLGFVTYTAGEGVHTMRIGGVDYKGTELRSLFGLRSTAFTMKAEAGGVRVTTKGYGHRVGMSQYGADAMALRGADYAEILAHYYQNTALTLYEN